MSNTNLNRPARSASIPIPGSTRRNIEDMLNLNSLSPSPSSTQSPTRQERVHQRSVANPRSFYGSLQASRPATTRHVSASTSSSTSRHSLGGGTGPTWGPRSFSSNVPITPSNPSLPAGSFEPRVIRGRIQHATSEDSHHHQEVGSIVQRRGSASSFGRTHVSRPTASASQSQGSSPSLHLNPIINSTPESHDSGLISTASAFPVPDYLQYSALRHLLCTDAPSNLPPSRHEDSPGLLAESGDAQEHRPRQMTPLTDSDDDSETSFGAFGRNINRARDRGRVRDREPTTTYASSVPLASTIPLQHLPTRWNEQDRNAALTISADGRELHFHGPTSQGEKEAAAARANHPVPPACGIYYYEVEILNKGQKGHISIGYSASDVRLTRLPGWERNSWGYHGDDGNSFASEKKGTPYGPVFTAGDIIGCGLDFDQHRVFYTKNGKDLGYVFENVGKDSPVFPSVGLRTAGEIVRVNFGHEGFKFKIDNYVNKVSERLWKSIQATPIKWVIDDTNLTFNVQADKNPLDYSRSTNKSGDMLAAETIKKEDGDDYEPMVPSQDFRDPIDKLIFSYLSHYGFEKTSRALQMERSKRNKLSELALQITQRHTATSGSLGENSAIKMETEDIKMEDAASATFLLPECPDGLDVMDLDNASSDLQYRQRIVNAILSGNIDVALREIQDRYPMALERNNGLLLPKLRCRKFVELVLDASDALKRIKAEVEAKEVEHEVTNNADGYTRRITDMDIDEEIAPKLVLNGTNGYSDAVTSLSSTEYVKSNGDGNSNGLLESHLTVEHTSALNEALAYGQKLHAEYSGDKRPEVESLFKQSYSLIAYDDPAEAGGDIAELASQESRVKLAQEVNLAVLESQGRPSRPALERLYRQTSAVLTQLGLLGVGAAVFADMNKEYCQQ